MTKQAKARAHIQADSDQTRSPFQSRPFGPEGQSAPWLENANRLGHHFATVDVQQRGPLSVQPKLRVGPANDKYEQEADRVAAQVVRQISTPGTGVTQQVRRKSAESAEANPSMGIPVAPEIEAGINAARSGGQPLLEGVRAPMERALGADFSRVRVHTDARADALNRAVQARAFTTGRDVFFRQGEYQPGNSEGRRLLAHELAHVEQSRYLGSGLVRRWLDFNGGYHDPPNPNQETFQPPAKWAQYEVWEPFEQDGRQRWKPKGVDLKILLQEQAAKGQQAKKQNQGAVQKYEFGERGNFTDTFFAPPEEIRFSQDTISPVFDGPFNIYETTVQLASGRLKPVAIEAIELVDRFNNGSKERVIVSVDNRRLWAFKQANLLRKTRNLGPPLLIKCQWITKQAENRQRHKFTAGEYGAAKTKVTDTGWLEKLKASIEQEFPK